MQSLFDTTATKILSRVTPQSDIIGELANLPNDVVRRMLNDTITYVMRIAYYDVKRYTIADMPVIFIRVPNYGDTRRNALRQFISMKMPIIGEIIDLFRKFSSRDDHVDLHSDFAQLKEFGGAYYENLIDEYMDELIEYMRDAPDRVFVCNLLFYDGEFNFVDEHIEEYLGDEPLHDSTLMIHDRMAVNYQMREIIKKVHNSDTILDDLRHMAVSDQIIYELFNKVPVWTIRASNCDNDGRIWDAIVVCIRANTKREAVLRMIEQKLRIIGEAISNDPDPDDQRLYHYMCAQDGFDGEEYDWVLARCHDAIMKYFTADIERPNVSCEKLIYDTLIH